MMIDLDIINQMDGYIGWKDKAGNYLGCNHNFANILQLNSIDEIIGLNDRDLIDYEHDSYQFHYQNDQAALSGQTVRCIHHSQHPYDGSYYHVVKKPLQHQNNIIGIIFHCQQLTNSVRNNLNPFKLSNRELECLKYLQNGDTSIIIAAKTGLAKRTIDFYIENIKNKMGCRTRTQVILKSLKYNKLA